MISLLIFVIYVVISIYVIRNLLLKTEKYETELNRIYDRCEAILMEMRAIDSQQMFERDDDVGSVFQQLVALIGDMRYILYENSEDEEEIEEPTIQDILGE